MTKKERKKRNRERRETARARNIGKHEFIEVEKERSTHLSSAQLVGGDFDHHTSLKQ